MAVTLLLADDSITIQRVIELTFADEDVRVVSASDGQLAIQKIDAEPPDIVLADVGMPKVDGYGVAAHVKQTPTLRHIPVLLLTGAFEPIDEAKARATGCDGILVKPFEPKVLIARVRELLAGQRPGELWPAELPRVEPVPVAPAPVAPPAKVVLPVTVPKVAPIVPITKPVAAPASVAPPQAPAPTTAPRVVPPPVAPPSVVSPPVVTALVAPPPAALPPKPAQAPSVVTAPPRPAAPVPAPIAGPPAGADAAMPQDLLRPANRNPPPPAQASHRTQLAPRDLPPPADAFESELDMLDVALSRLEPTARPHELDEATKSDFARDLQTLRKEQPEGEPAAAGDPGAPTGAGRQMFGDWDLPIGRAPKTGPDPGGPDVSEPIDIIPEELPAGAAMSTPQAPAPAQPQPAQAPISMPVAAVPEPLAPVAPAAPAPVAPLPPAPPPQPALVIASAPPAPPPVPVPPAPRPSLANAFSALLAAERAQPPAKPLASSATLSEGAIEDVVKRVLARMTDAAVHKVVLDAAERIIREEIDRLKAPPDSSGR